MHVKIFLALILAVFVNAGNILFVMPVIPISSKITWYPLARALADRGHEVMYYEYFQYIFFSGIISLLKL